jgi:branched-chain amino acid transport system substrate-binding protein
MVIILRVCLPWRIGLTTSAPMPSRNDAYKRQYGEFIFEYAGGVVAQTFMIAAALEKAASTDPQKVRDAIAALDLSEGYAAMCPGGRV